jgi:predicted glycosyltransferase
MNILFFAFHPVDPQLFHHTAKTLEKKGNKVLFAVLEKEDIVNVITKSFGFKTVLIGKNKKSFLGRVMNSPIILLRIAFFTIRFKPDLFVSALSPYVGLISKILGIKSIGLTDTEIASFNNNIAFNFFDSILSPDCFYEEIPEAKHIPFQSYKEFAYLHPNWFKPDRSVLERLHLERTDKIVLLRFSALNATHDIGARSEGILNKDEVLKYLKEIEKYARILISVSERDMGEEFEKYRLKIHPVDHIHLLSFCTLYIGEGTTTASEAGVLGVPWINILKTKRGYLMDQENNYRLGKRVDKLKNGFELCIKWLKDDDLVAKWEGKQARLLSDKIDLSSFLTWFIENYPESHKIMKENPDYQNRFK